MVENYRRRGRARAAHRGCGAGFTESGRLFGNKAARNPSLPERSLAYSLTVQKMRDGKPYQGEFQSSGQEIFENGWKFRMNLTSPQEGYVYLLNEGPAEGGVATYNVLFPEERPIAARRASRPVRICRPRG